MENILKFVRENRQRYIEELIALLKIPSISAKSEHRDDCYTAANFLKKELDTIGFETTVYDTPGNPIVLAHYQAGDDKPTVLIYGHYDVQPVDPFDLWKTPPFEPRIENEIIYARGATDDKGQVFAHIKAVEAILKENESLPVNVTFLIEGEEEIASTHLEAFIETYRDKLNADIAVISDSCQYGPGMPAICYGLRGIAAAEIRVDGPDHDLHSGSFGGAVPNPCQVLCEIIAKLKDEKGGIKIQGFYDNVLPLEEWERETYKELPWNDDDFLKETGALGLHGEKGYTTIERKWGRPTLEINGIYGGYDGEGSKTIIPAWAGAKVTMRLVPNQTPGAILDKFRQGVEAVAPDYAKVTVTDHSGGGAVIVPKDADFMPEAIEAIEKGFGTKPLFIREGGSIPVVCTLKEQLGVDTVLMGFGLPDDNAHSPNEKFSLDDFMRGIETSVWFMKLCGER